MRRRHQTLDSETWGLELGTWGRSVSSREVSFPADPGGVAERRAPASRTGRKTPPGRSRNRDRRTYAQPSLAGQRDGRRFQRATAPLSDRTARQWTARGLCLGAESARSDGPRRRDGYRQVQGWCERSASVALLLLGAPRPKPRLKDGHPGPRRLWRTVGLELRCPDVTMLNA